MKNYISENQLREFGLITGFGIPLAIGWIIPLFGGHEFKIWTILVGIILVIIALVRPILLLHPYKIWMKLGHILGFINSRIIIGLIFFLVLLPIAFIMKLFNYDPLKNKRNKNKTYREIIKNRKIDLTKMF